VIGVLAALSIALVGAIGWRAVRALAQAVQERVAAEQAAAKAEAPANPIRLYTTSWCPHCAHARQWLKAQHVEYAELDVEKNVWANRENRRLNGRGSVPTLDADGEVVKGFSADEFRAALDRAAAHQAH
jgi:glutaredoxin